MAELVLHMAHGGLIATPASLASTTTYVVLEQETWFEKEVSALNRWLGPGMTAIDIGANLGIYALPMARLVGPSGRVFAYEPASEPRRLLQRSVELNEATNLSVCDAALSDGVREGQLGLSSSSEANSLNLAGPGERVPVSCLDVEDSQRDWLAPDFVKIDAEGEEERILKGGKSFFARHSPLVMFEVRAGREVNEGLRAAFRAVGYGIFRLLPGEPILVPDDPDQPVESFELNLLAAKPDRAARLAGEGSLVEAVPNWEPDDAVHHRAFALLGEQAFAAVTAPLCGDTAALDPAYRNALAAYAHWRDRGVPLAERYAALRFAYRGLVGLCQRAPNFPRLSTLARVAWEAGERGAAVAALNMFIEETHRRPRVIAEPFWPACPRYDALAPEARVGDWFIASACEQLERLSSFSSMFFGCTPGLEWLCGTPFASSEMERRRVLWAMRSGQAVEISDRLRRPAPDHLNASVWASGDLPPGRRT